MLRRILFNRTRTGAARNASIAKHANHSHSIKHARFVTSIASHTNSHTHTHTNPDRYHIPRSPDKRFPDLHSQRYSPNLRHDNDNDGVFLSTISHPYLEGESKESSNDLHEHQPVFSLPSINESGSASESGTGSMNPTAEQKAAEMQQLALKLQSLRDPKVRSSFLQSQDPERINTLMYHARGVVRYYADPKRVLPLSNHHNNHNRSTPEISSTSTHSLRRTRTQPGQLVLSGPEFCHSLLSTVILPLYAQTNDKHIGIGLTSDHINTLIDMCLLTIQSLGRLSSNSNQRSRTNYNGHAKARTNRTRAEGTTSLGDRAEELLRLVVNMPAPTQIDHRGDRTEVSFKRFLLNRLYNNTLHTWSAIAASEKDPYVAKNAALRAEKLLLDLAMSKKNHQKVEDWNHHGRDDKTDGDGSTTLLEWIQPDIVSFNTTINAWSKSGRYEHVAGEKRDVTTITAAERAEAILMLLQDMYDEDSEKGGTGNGDDDGVLLPNRMSYEAVIQGWSLAMDREAPDRAMKVLNDMLDRYLSFYADQNRENSNDQNQGSDRSNHGASPPFPSHRAFSSAITTWARSSRDDSVEKAEDILKHMKELGNTGYEQSKPDTFAYNAVLYTYDSRIRFLLGIKYKYANQDHKLKLLKEAYALCDRMDEIIQEMVENSVDNRNSITIEETAPNFITHKVALFPFLDIGTKAVALKRGQKTPFSIYECASRADSHLRSLEGFLQDHSNSRRSSKSLTIEAFKDIMKLYVSVGKYEEAKDIFDLLAKSTPSGGFSQIRGNAYDYEEMVDLLLQTGMRSKRASPCTTILSDMDSYFTGNTSDRNNRIQMSRRMLNALIEANSRLADSHIRYARRADKIMSESIKKYNQHLETISTSNPTKSNAIPIQPSTFTVHCVLEAYANACNIRKLSKRDRNLATQRMEEILRMMEEMHDKRSNTLDQDPTMAKYIAKVTPNANAYNLLLKAYSSHTRFKMKREDAEDLTRKANELLERMDRLFSSGQNPLVKPDKYTYSSFLNILAQSKSQDVTDRAMEILNKNAASGATDNDVTVFNTALKVITNAGHASTHAVEILEKMENGSFSNESSLIRPDKYTYSIVIASLANEGTVDAAQKVEELYKGMMRTFEAEQLQNLTSARKVRPDIYCYNSIICAWANIGMKESFRRAEEHLDMLLLDDSSIEADVSSFSGLIKGCSKRSDADAGEDCERILRKMEEYFAGRKSNTKVNIANYMQTIAIYQKEENPEGCLRILESVLHQLKDVDYRGRSDLEKVRFAYNNVMKHYHKTLGKHSASKVQNVFDILHADDQVEPDRFSYVILMSSYILSQSPDSYKIVNKILDSIIDYDAAKEKKEGVRPCIELYNLVLQACEKSAPNEGVCVGESPVSIAFERFGEIQASVDPTLMPTNQTYCHLLAICKKHVGDEAKRVELVKQLFQKCCKDGQVTNRTLSLCRQTLSDPQLKNMLLDLGLEKGVLSIEDFPEKFKKNVSRNAHERNHRR